MTRATDDAVSRFLCMLRAKVCSIISRWGCYYCKRAKSVFEWLLALTGSYSALWKILFLILLDIHTLSSTWLSLSGVGGRFSHRPPAKAFVHGTAGRRPIILTWRCLLLAWHLRTVTGPLGHLFPFPDKRFDLGHPLLMCPLCYSSKVPNLPSCDPWFRRWKPVAALGHRT